MTVHIEEEPLGYGVDQAYRAVNELLGRGNRIDFSGRRRSRVGRRFLRYRFVDGFRVGSRHRTQWPAYLVCEYEPARLGRRPAHDRAILSFELGLDMLVLDPVVANLLAAAIGTLGSGSCPRISHRARRLSCHADPTMIFVVSNGDGVTDAVWTELGFALG